MTSPDIQVGIPAESLKCLTLFGDIFGWAKFFVVKTGWTCLQPTFCGGISLEPFQISLFTCEVEKPCGEFMKSRRKSHWFGDWGIWRAFGNRFGNDMMVTAMFLYHVRPDTRLQYLKTIHAYLVLVVIFRGLFSNEEVVSTVFYKDFENPRACFTFYSMFVAGFTASKTIEVRSTKWETWDMHHPPKPAFFPLQIVFNLLQEGWRSTMEIGWLVTPPELSKSLGTLVLTTHDTTRAKVAQQKGGEVKYLGNLGISWEACAFFFPIHFLF